MALFVECGKAGSGSLSGTDLAVEVGSMAEWSEEVASGAATAGVSPDNSSVFTLTATADGYALFTTAGTVPTAKVTKSRRILSGQRVSFAARVGDRVGWVEGA